MKNNVPEAVSAEMQLDHLREKLLGNKSFRACRGKLGRSAADIINDFITEVESPTQFCKTWDDMNAAMRVMGNLLAQYKRDRYDVAYDELLCALEGTHIITGETIPLEETIPVTIVMLYPELTVHMVRWIIEQHWSDLDHYLDVIDGIGKESEGHEETRQLFANFPTLETHSRERRRRDDYEGWDLCRAFRESVLENFETPSDWIRLKIGFNQWNDHLELHDQTFAFVVIGKDQGEVLAEFARDEQEGIATWQVNIPCAIVKDKSDSSYHMGFYVGFHEESEHGNQTAKYPALTSKGVHAGLGVRILTKRPDNRVDNLSDYPVPYQGGQTRDRKFRIFMTRD